MADDKEAEIKAKRKAAQARWQAKNPEWRRQWRASHVELCRGYARKKRANNLEKMREREKLFARAKRAKNRKPRKKGPTRAEYRRQNRERINAVNRQWKAAHPERTLESAAKSGAKRRALKAALADAHYTIEEIRALRKKYGGRCGYCDAKGRMTIDHIIPLSKGGSNSIRNIQFLCGPCNSSKNDRDPIEFAREKGMLL